MAILLTQNFSKSLSHLMVVLFFNNHHSVLQLIYDVSKFRWGSRHWDGNRSMGWKTRETSLCSFRLEVSQGNSGKFLDKTFAHKLQTLNWKAAMKTDRKTNTAQERGKDLGITKNSNIATRIHGNTFQKITVFQDLILCSLVHAYQCFGAASCLHLQRTKVSWYWKEVVEIQGLG